MWECQECREILEESFDLCWKCGTERDRSQNHAGQVVPERNNDEDTSPPDDEFLPSHHVPASNLSAFLSDGNFLARNLIWAFRGLACLAAISGIVNASTAGIGPVGVLTVLVASLVATTVLLAFSEFLRLAIAIEANTRRRRDSDPPLAKPNE